MNAKMVILMVVLIVGVGIGGFAIGQKYKLVPQEAGVSVTVTPTQPMVGGDREIETTVTPSPSPSPVNESETIKTLIKQALVAEHGPDANALIITVSKIQGNYASGGASGEGGGGMWLAAKDAGTWKLVWDGNGTIGCEDIAPYNFPTSMVPECWNAATGKNVVR